MGRMRFHYAGDRKQFFFFSSWEGKSSTFWVCRARGKRFFSVSFHFSALGLKSTTFPPRGRSIPSVFVKKKKERKQLSGKKKAGRWCCRCCAMCAAGMDDLPFPDDDDVLTPPELAAAHDTLQDRALPKSRAKYEQQYAEFMSFLRQKNAGTHISPRTVMAYFVYLQDDTYKIRCTRNERQRL